jgi:hypothetical protein
LFSVATLLSIACGSSNDASSEPVDVGGAAALGGMGNGGQSIAAGGAAHPAGGSRVVGGSSTAGGSRAVGGSSAAGGSSAVGGAAGTGGGDNTVDLAEKGLCRITMDCGTQKIVDTPPVLCTFEVKDSAGTVAYSDHAAVELRGRSSLGFPKKNYAVELRTAANVDNPANLLGMGGEADWVLDGAWADRSFMRNRLTFGLFRDMSSDRWAPQARYCELTTNGKYAGIYVLLEKIKRDDDRIVLPADDGTGSTFVVKQDDDGALKLTIGSGSKWQVVYPNSSIITTTQTQAVQNWLNQLGTALRSSNAADTLGMFNQAALVDWILVEEFAKNIDAFNLSLYFVRNAGAPAWVVPWDIDLGYGQPTLTDAPNDQPSGWVYTRTSLITKLAQNASLRQALGLRWRELRKGIFSTQAIMARLDGYAAILNPDAIARNFALWPIADVDFSQFYEPYTFYRVSNYAEEVTHFRTWIEQRLTWLDANIDNYPTQ